MTLFQLAYNDPLTTCLFLYFSTFPLCVVGAIISGFIEKREE